MPRTITPGCHHHFTYDPDRTRTTQTAPGETTVYLTPRWDLGGHYEKTTHSSGIVEHKHYIYGSSGPVALYTLKSDGTSTTRYLHKDHLGSVDTLTSETGTVLERYSYDAFGKRRLPNGTDGAVPSPATHHGYTGHEHLDGLGLIHMNGRIYDPALGRFTQADPYIQDPTNSQSLNRYSYVENNPLKYTDPSGYKKIWKQKWFRETAKIVVIAVAAAYTGGAAYSAFMGSAISSAGGAMAITGAQYAAATASATIVGGMAGGFTGGLLSSGGEIKPAVRGGLSGGLTNGVGGYFGDVWSWSRVAANSVAGGVSSELQGGRFGDGFLTSGVMSGARYAYNSVVGYDATWGAGENRPGDTKYQPNPDTGRLLSGDIGRNIIGFNDNYEPNNSCIFCSNSFRQGSPLSRALNVIPGGNAIAGLDDYINNVTPTRLGESAWFKLVTIPMAVGVTIPALFDRVPGYRPQDLVMH